MVESGLEALAENQTTNELLAERGGGTPRRGPHAFSSGLTALSFPRTGRFSIREVVLEGYAIRQKTGISSQSAQASFLCLRKRLSLSTPPRFIKSLEDPASYGEVSGDYISTSFVGGAAFPAFVVAHAPNGSMFDEATYTVTGGLSVGGKAHSASDHFNAGSNDTLTGSSLTAQ
jgi:hypothetical protein